MSAKIICDAETLTLVKNAIPGDSRILVSKDVLNLDSLPDEFVVKIQRVFFDPEKDFEPVGGSGDEEKFMPAKRLYSELSDKRGIEGTKDYVTQPIYEEVDYNRLLCKPLEEPPLLRKINCGFRAVKWGTVVMEDGVRRLSSPCIVDFNAWKRCCAQWSAEEEKTNGYDPATAKQYENGNKYWEVPWYDSKTKTTKYNKIFPKFDTKYKRNRHLDETLKFDQRNADTKTWHVVIRVICGMNTGYTKAQIQDGFFVIYKIIQSPESVKLDAMARRYRMAHGDQVQITGDQFAQPEVVPEARNIATREEDKGLEGDFTLQPDPEPDPEPLNEREQMHKDLTEWRDKGFIPDKIGDFVNVKKSVDNIIQFLERDEPEKNIEKWAKARAVVAQIKATIPAGVLNTKSEKKEEERDIF
jgi:hypothetical protein